MGIRLAKHVKITNDGTEQTYYSIPKSIYLRLKYRYSDMGMKHYIKKMIRKGYLAKDLEPLKCTKCKCTEFKRDQEWYGPTGVEEFTLQCTNCGEHVGHWSYGSWLL